jgi:hypothetical protein
LFVLTKVDLSSREPRQSHANLVGDRIGVETDQSTGMPALLALLMIDLQNDRRGWRPSKNSL